MATIQDFSGFSPTWCPGCGDWGIGGALKSALVQLEHDPSSVFVVFGIGCSGNMNDFLNAYAIHSLHGRAIPNAIGIKLANHKAPVIVVVGDGDCYGEGGNHFLHACRGNHDMTVVVHDNGVYGLTTGQVAPTAPKNFKSKSTPSGIIETPINPLSLAISQGATFVSQGFAGDVLHMTDLIKQGIRHKGFALVNILQPCVTFNKVMTYDYYKEKSYKISEDYNKTDASEAIRKAAEQTSGDKFPLGVLFKVEKPTFTDSLPQLSRQTLTGGERFENFDELLSDFE